MASFSVTEREVSVTVYGMKSNKTPLACTLMVLALLFAEGSEVWSEEQKSAPATLTVTNGEFSDLTDLQEGAYGWYAGMPKGWAGTTLDKSNVWKNEQGNLIANVSTLSQISPKFVAFTQEVGMVSASSEVTLTVEVSEPWRGAPFVLGAAIYDAVTEVPLAKGDFSKAGIHTVKADKIPAGTRVKIGFWAGTGTPGIDNVKIEAKPLP